MPRKTLRVKPGPKPRNVAERFWEKVQKDAPNGCWLWTAAIMPNGYGSFGVRHGSRAYAHRWAYEQTVGPIPPGLQIDHLCRNRACVNPAHLEVVTQRENLLRGVGASAKNAAKTHCPQGHPYDEANTYVWHGNRRCRICNATAMRRYKAQRRWRT